MDSYNRNTFVGLITAFLSEHLNQRNGIPPEANLLEYDGFHSMLVVEIILFIEKTLKITLPDEYYGMEYYETIGRIVDFVDSIQCGKA